MHISADEVNMFVHADQDVHTYVYTYIQFCVHLHILVYAHVNIRTYEGSRIILTSVPSLWGGVLLYAMSKKTVKRCGNPKRIRLNKCP